MAFSGEVWEVTGGASKGGLIVREGKDISSLEVEGRLATGALVIALEHDVDAERMMYEKIAGSGPESGWVSTGFKGKQLLAKVSQEAEDEEAEVEDEEDAEGFDVKEAYFECEDDDNDMAMQLYGLRFGQAEVQDEGFPGLEEAAACEREEEATDLPESDDSAELEHDLSFEVSTSEETEDEEEEVDPCLVRCRHCRLPMGHVAFAAEQEGDLLHGECMAQLAVSSLRQEEALRKQREAHLKAERREQLEIGWKVEHIPRNVGPTMKLGCPITQGMCCLVLDEDSHRVSVAPTIEPAAAVNIEYLSLALQVRRRDNREPLFSLDPVDADSEFFDPKASMLMKRFEPSWIAGTSVGDVLFQSDFHLKELSMGEHEQPVIGMKCCHDFSNLEGAEHEWNAREWFVVRKAEVQMSEDNVLVPSVKMGVEARQQIVGENGLEDVKTTRPNHPMVRYAESFTHNFDLIAERKSVVFHLRELAKASVLAKFLVEADFDLEDAWFDLADEAKEACCLEIPQLWNDRCRAQIRVQDGKPINADAGFNASRQSLYGGVQFGLDKFALSGARQPARMMSAGLAARQFVQPARHLSATLSAGLATRQFQRSFGPMGVQPARVAAGVGLDKFALSGARQPARMMSAGLAARQFVQPARHLSATLSAGLATRQFQRSFGPMGVQPARVAAGVGLDKFALSGARQPARMMSAGLAARQFVQPARHLSATLSAGLATRQFQRSFGPMGVQPARVAAGVARGVDLNLDEFNLSAPTLIEGKEMLGQFDNGLDISDAFWMCLNDERPSTLSEEHKNLLKMVFNPSLCDRHEEGDRFIPPETSQAYVDKLRFLLEEEESMREQRIDHFCGKTFSRENPGQLFPSTWAESIEIACEEGSRREGSALEPRSDWQARELEQAVRSAAAVFDKTAEDGTRFRVYRLGSLEVRTVQEAGMEELVAAVFSAGTSAEAERPAGEQEQFVKAAEYVERSGKNIRCYVVLETEQKSSVVVEEGPDGVLKLQQNPRDLPDRNSLAKLLRSQECRESITVADLERCQGQAYGWATGDASGPFLAQ